MGLGHQNGVQEMGIAHLGSPAVWSGVWGIAGPRPDVVRYIHTESLHKTLLVPWCEIVVVKAIISTLSSSLFGIHPLLDTDILIPATMSVHRIYQSRTKRINTPQLGRLFDKLLHQLSTRSIIKHNHFHPSLPKISLAA
jgi:hypothetical protein